MRRTFPHVDSQLLVDSYNSGLSLNQIAKRVPMTALAIRYRLLKAGVTMRSQCRAGISPTNKLDLPLDDIINAYQSGTSANAIARQFRVSVSAILKRLRRAEIPLRTRADYDINYGRANGHWKGGLFTRSDGYVMAAAPKDRPGRRTQFQHRLVMEAALGRRLNHEEFIHHLNGIRHDNRIENLVITTISAHDRRTLIRALQLRIRELEAFILQKTGSDFR